MSRLRPLLLPLLVMLPLLPPGGRCHGVSAFQSMTFRENILPFELPDAELVAPPSQLDRCRCELTCAARPGCLSADHCPDRSPGTCRLYGRWGNLTLWKISPNTCTYSCGPAARG